MNGESGNFGYIYLASTPAYVGQANKLNNASIVAFNQNITYGQGQVQQGNARGISGAVQVAIGNEFINAFGQLVSVAQQAINYNNGLTVSLQGSTTSTTVAASTTTTIPIGNSSTSVTTTIPAQGGYGAPPPVKPTQCFPLSTDIIGQIISFFYHLLFLCG